MDNFIITTTSSQIRDEEEINEEIFLQKLPKEISELYEYCIPSSYAFLNSMAYVFANHITKSGSFFRLKMALMISLVSQNEYPKNCCSLLVQCDDDLIVNRLFQWCCSFAKIHFFYSSVLHTLTGNSISCRAPNHSDDGESKNQQTNHILNGGTLNLAANGIHVFTNAINLDALPKKEKVFLEHALESNEIVAKESKATNVNIEDAKLKSIIWANVLYRGKHSQSHRQAPLKVLICQNTTDESDANLQRKSRWLELFGMVVTIKDAGLFSTDQRSLSSEHWQQYFDICASIKPVLTVDAEHIVRHYFCLSRQYRPDNQFNTKSIRTILQMANCIAKLNLHSRVTKHDALLAVMLYEEQLCALFCGSMSPIVFAHWKDQTHITEGSDQNVTFLMNDSYMDLFESTLLNSR